MTGDRWATRGDLQVHCNAVRLAEHVSSPTLIKKYGNRRLYDTGASRYITLEELSRKIQEGADVRVVDAKTGEDLTQGTLTQIIVEGRGVGRMLPVALLVQLIRLGDSALAEFFGHYVSDALRLYLEIKRGASAVARYNPFAAMPFAAGDALARMWMSSPVAAGRAAQDPSTWSPPADAEGEHADDAPPGASPEPARAADEPGRGHTDELAQLRRDLEELKSSLLQRNAPKPRPARSASKRKPR